MGSQKPSYDHTHGHRPWRQPWLIVGYSPVSTKLTHLLIAQLHRIRKKKVRFELIVEKALYRKFYH